MVSLRTHIRRGVCYLNHAYASFPKASGVADAIHKAVQVPDYELNRRFPAQLGELERYFGVTDVSHGQIIATTSCTAAIEFAIAEVVQRNIGRSGTFLTSTMEHDALAAPLQRAAAASGGNLVIRRVRRSACDLEPFPLDQLISLVEDEASNVCLVAFSMASNVTGEVLLEAHELHILVQCCQRRGVPVLVDGAQTVGILPIHLPSLGVDYFAFGGYKGLRGPHGIGGLYCSEGSYGAALSYCSVGSVNKVGLAGLVVAIQNRASNSQIDEARSLARRFAQLVTGISPRVLLHCSERWLGTSPRSTTLALSVSIQGMGPEEVARRLLDHGIYVAGGMHCAPQAHAALGTAEAGGTVRFSFGPENTEGDVGNAVAALAEIQEKS